MKQLLYNVRLLRGLCRWQAVQIYYRCKGVAQAVGQYPATCCH